MPLIGKIGVAAGILLVVSSLAVIFMNKVFPLGSLPGDITVEQENFKLYFPFATGLVVSGVLSGLALLVMLLF